MFMRSISLICSCKTRFKQQIDPTNHDPLHQGFSYFVVSIMSFLKLSCSIHGCRPRGLRSEHFRPADLALDRWLLGYVTPCHWYQVRLCSLDTGREESFEARLRRPQPHGPNATSQTVALDQPTSDRSLGSQPLARYDEHFPLNICSTCCL